MPTFKLQCVNKKFFLNKKESFYALNNISLVFPNTGLVTIAGKSGSGKSTLLNILMGIEKPTSGDIYFDNKKINRQNDRNFSFFHLHKVSMIYQHYNLFEELSAYDNAVAPLLMQGYSKKDAKKKVEDMFYELGIESLLKHKVSKLSGGEKQRVAIIRAMVTNPLVLLCDEPTGALDSKNGEEIMKILKRLSKKILVVMVSHNQAHIEKYSDRVITLEDGYIKNDSKPLRFSYELLNKKKEKYSSKWKSLIFNSHLKANLKKNIFAFFVLLIGFVISLTSIGFIYGSSASFDNLLYQSLSATTAKVSIETVYKIENSPINLIKVIRPDLDEIDEVFNDVNSINISNNYDYIFSSYPETTYKKSLIDSPNLVPLYSFKDNKVINNLLVSGKVPEDYIIEEVVVNEEFVKQLKHTNETILNEKVMVSFSNEVSVVLSNNENKIIKDQISYNLSLIIRGVVKEFGFLNSPKIYYSSIALENFFYKKSMVNYSKEVGHNVSFKSYLDEISGDNPVSSYSYNLFVNNKEDIKNIYNLYKSLGEEDNSIKIDSSFFETYSSYRELLDSFSIALIVFVNICFLGLNFILGMIALSTFIEKKKESAILTCLGARNKDVTSLFLEEIHLIVILSFLSSIGLTIPLQMLLNRLFSSYYGLTNLFVIPYESFYNIPFLLPIGLLLIFLIISFLFVYIPISIYKSKTLSEELRDE